MPQISVYLEKEEEEQLISLLSRFKVNSKSDAIRIIIKEYLLKVKNERGNK